MSILRRLRIRQIQFCSYWICILSGIPFVPELIRSIREFPLIRQILMAAVGYNRPFDTLAAAQEFIARYDGGGHSHPYTATNIMRTVDTATPSDYAAMFALQPILPHARTVFDFGGNVGNLLYCYARYLPIPSDLAWTVFDVPANIELGEKVKCETGEQRLRFTRALHDGEGVDVFIACGSVHYFEKPLPSMIAEFQNKPRYVLINRSPFSEGMPFATVQDVGRFRVACLLHNREAFIRGFEAAGYDLVDQWRAAERSLVIPCYPDRSVSAYSGMFFRLRDSDPVLD